MSLEKQLELNTAAMNDLAHMIAGLTATIGTVQAPGSVHFTAHKEVSTVEHLEKKADEANRRANPKGGENESADEARAASQEQSRTAAALAAAKKEAVRSSDTTSGEQSQQTGESSSPELTYNEHVKPATLKLSQKMGREVAIAVLGRFGVKGAQNLDASQWADYIAHCESVMNGGEV